MFSRAIFTSASRLGQKSKSITLNVVYPYWDIPISHTFRDEKDLADFLKQPPQQFLRDPDTNKALRHTDVKQINPNIIYDIAGSGLMMSYPSREKRLSREQVWNKIFEEKTSKALEYVLKKENPGVVLELPKVVKDGLKVSFSDSEVKYKDVAELVGLEPLRKFNDVGTFALHRSRIPTNVFKSIVEDMDIMLMQYGLPPEQMTEETRSRFLSPIFNRLVAEFGFSFRNLSELIIEGRIATKGSIECYFKAFGSVSIVFVEVELKIGDLEERLNAISQVIAKSDACDWNNAINGFKVPVFGILCDGKSFEFFSFDGSTSTSPTSFTRGCFPGDPPEFRRGLQLSDFTLTGSARFIAELRQISEVIFDLLMSSFVSSLTAFQQRSERNGMKDQKPRKSLAKWEEALKHANDALDKFRKAEGMRKDQVIDKANAAAEEAMKALKQSVELVAIDKTDPIMTRWNDADVEKA